MASWATSLTTAMAAVAMMATATMAVLYSVSLGSVPVTASWATSLLVTRRMAVILTMTMEVIMASMMVSLGRWLS
jgi:hypothetical protein